ncbi:putative MFS family arabinose efflux permease [Breoghania corrubedonensis]|uniref:Putative MFS family arabinose efflux permease n=1 Tax=Breoghania corrubedonensis TaxID=665038 RepID=A0A2T5UW30_9HYPH|nr:MFS transporter [Breoghania corrubedonensis]PTW55692.1 putative MFS family arabinose efflux permease [Breoghania corrubedonensis]
MAASASTGPSDGPFAPLRHKVFLVLWMATVIGNTGSFVRDVASAWLVTSLSPSPLSVALIQAAATLPLFLFSLPAGVLTDILDRRKFLIAIQVLLACVSLGLLALSATGTLSVATLIGLTFMGGLGAALMIPTWQVIVPELVSKETLRSAIALNSLGINIARAVGPAVGGLLLSVAGAAVTYGVDVASYVVVIGALLWWPRGKTAEDPLAERFSGAFRAGLRYALASRQLHLVLIRAGVYFAAASAIWALLPLVARNLLHGGSGFYGLLLGSTGAGAIAGALLLPVLRRHAGPDGLMLASAITIAASMAVLVLFPIQALSYVLFLLIGAAWITALTTLNGTAQAILPNWVRGRSLAVYLTVFNAALTGGSVGWGLVAEFSGISGALLIAAALLASSAAVFHRIRLPKGDLDLTPANHWPEPLTQQVVEHDRGPVLVTIEYRVAAEDQPAFLRRMRHLSRERRRDGAYSWGISEDASDKGLMLEWFFVESWAEHLRQHKRVSKADADIQSELLKYHAGSEPPVVRHLLAADLPRD